MVDGGAVSRNLSALSRIVRTTIAAPIFDQYVDFARGSAGG
jgi:hypothetical protein